MLTTDQKATILRRAGVNAPTFPFRSDPDRQQQADARPIVKQDWQADARHDPRAHWARTIDVLFARYSTARAAQSLYEAEQSRRHDGAPRTTI